MTDEGRMAYIDSKLAKSRAVDDLQAQPQDTATTTGSTSDFPSHARRKVDNSETQRQPATIGKLQEIDLGDEARKRNIERTNKARRRLDGEVVEDGVSEGGKKKKIRLNRDGTVWIPRKRRGSDDIKRDQLVEAVLRENRRRFSFPLSSTFLNF